MRLARAPAPRADRHRSYHDGKLGGECGAEPKGWSAAPPADMLHLTRRPCLPFLFKTPPMSMRTGAVLKDDTVFNAAYD